MWRPVAIIILGEVNILSLLGFLRKFLLFVILCILCVPFASADIVVHGDVLVVFKPEAQLTNDSLSEEGAEFIRISEIARSYDAELVEIYVALSISANKIFALLHSKAQSEDALIEQLLARPDVIAASPNRMVLVIGKLRKVNILKI